MGHLTASNLDAFDRVAETRCPHDSPPLAGRHEDGRDLVRLETLGAVVHRV